MASVCGILLVPCLGKGIYESVISSLICLAIGTMLGDAILHLIPQVNAQWFSNARSRDAPGNSLIRSIIRSHRSFIRLFRTDRLTLLLGLIG